MSRKAPKKYVQQQAPKATADEERQARRVINGIIIGLLVLLAITVISSPLLMG